jgi:hypothetical protein
MGSFVASLELVKFVRFKVLSLILISEGLASEEIDGSRDDLRARKKSHVRACGQMSE